MSYNANPDIHYIEYPRTDIYFILKRKTEALYAKYLAEDNMTDLELALKTALLCIDLNDIIKNNFEHAESGFLRSEKTKDQLEFALQLASELYKINGEKIYDNIFRIMEESRAEMLIQWVYSRHIAED